MLDLYGEIQGPFHYSHIAEKLGLSKYTAYDMLRLLEEKGYVESVYETHESGPGRASVLFKPTIKAREAFEQLAGGDTTNWEAAKERVIARIEAGEFEDAELAEEVLVQMAGGIEDVVYCAKVIGDLVTRLRARAASPDGLLCLGHPRAGETSQFARLAPVARLLAWTGFR